MAIPIGDTPVLTGEAAKEWWDTVEKQKNQKFIPLPTPNVEKLRQGILADAKKKRTKK